ncbi:hypothetical protein B0H14DRAFT_3503947 [Mycena olivaceomarginata]|nr:hypothetical protein B0H14DRAFT_3503947 [Mycena olivaceomarginata]
MTTLWLPLPLRSPCAPTPPAPRPPSHRPRTPVPALPLRTRHVHHGATSRYTLPAPSMPCPSHPVPPRHPHRLPASTATQTCTHTAASHPRMDRSSLSPLYTGLLRTVPSLHFGAAPGPPTSTMSTPPPPHLCILRASTSAPVPRLVDRASQVHHLLLRCCSESTLTTLFLVHAPVFAHRLPTTAPLSQTRYIQHRCSTHARAEAAPVIRRLRMHAARLSTPVRSLQDPSSTVRPRVRQSSARTSTNYRLHSRPCGPLRTTAFSPIPCSSSLSFTPSSSPSTSPIPEREPCASIVQQRRINIRLMCHLPAACAASPVALIVSPPIPIPPLPPASFRAAAARHLPRLPPTMPPIPCRRRCGVPGPLRVSASILCPPRAIAPHHTSTSSLNPHPLYHLSLRRVLAFSPPT